MSEREQQIAAIIEEVLGQAHVAKEPWQIILARRIAALPITAETVRRVAALLGKEIYCGQDEAAPADNPCKKTWAAYKRRCPECALHPNERNDLARAVLAALEG